MPAMKLRPATLRHVDNIMDTFAGADGGGKFVCFRILIEEMDRQAGTGDVAAQKIVDVVMRFSRLLDTAVEVAQSRKIQ